MVLTRSLALVGRACESECDPLPVLTNIRYEIFAQALANGIAPLDAYEQAGYKRNFNASSRLWNNVDIKQRVRELVEEAAIRTTITVARVLEELACIAFFDIGDVVEFGMVEQAPLKSPGRRRKPDPSFVKIKNSKNLPPHVRRAVAKVRKGIHGVSIEAHNKLTALGMLGDHLEMWKKTEKRDGASLADLVLESMKITGAKRPGDDARVINGEVNE